MCDVTKIFFACFQSYETSESRLKREFETYGPIKRVGINNHPFQGSGYCVLSSVRGLWPRLVFMTAHPLPLVFLVIGAKTHLFQSISKYGFKTIYTYVVSQKWSFPLLQKRLICFTLSVFLQHVYLVYLVSMIMIADKTNSQYVKGGKCLVWKFEVLYPRINCCAKVAYANFFYDNDIFFPGRSRPCRLLESPQLSH